LWDFGDGATSSVPYTTHSYSADGTYTVSLTTTNCDLQGSYTAFSDTVIQLCSHNPTVYTSRPWLCKNDTLWTEPADSYQWFAYGVPLGVPLPETNQYLPDYTRYRASGFSVLSTVNGCSEFSKLYSENPEWSGYYFDGLGDPCDGDTVAFAVLHNSGSLPGSETILWFKNDTLLPLMTNEDTLLISTSGKYECKVIDPNAKCPSDTTSYLLEYNCGGLGIEERNQELSWCIFPNPASEIITIKFTKYPVQGQVQIYNAFGRLTRSVTLSAATTELDIADLLNGLYYIRLKNNKQPALKFIKL
jgi:hypothetical protein